MLRETPREQSVRWPEGQPKDEIHMECSRRICMETMGSTGTHFFFQRYRKSLTLLRGKKRRGEEGKGEEERGEERRVTPGES